LPALWRVTLGGVLLLGYAAWGGGPVHGQQYERVEAYPGWAGPMVWTAEDLERSRQQIVAGANRTEAFQSYITNTHAYIMVHRPEVPPGEPPLAERHAGVTDVYFIVGGEGALIVGGEMQDVREARLGEELGTMTTGRRIPVTKGSIVNIPPGTSHATVPGPGGMTYVLQKVNIGMYPWSLIAGTPGSHSMIHPSPDWIETVAYAADDIERTRQQLMAGGNRQELFEEFVSPTHSFIMLHRTPQPPGEPLSFEVHEGVADVYYIVGGEGTVVVDGVLEVDEGLDARPGETRGTMTGGRRIPVTKGSILNIPPGTSHGTVAGPDGMTYILQKINVGMYPWSLINGAP
jgi:mannose-6-phosphate isomerase-like protein (cupin superfamily)